MSDGLWSRVRRLGTKVEDEIFEFTEEDGEEEVPGRNTLIALLNAFLILWKANTATVLERILGLLGLGSLAWLLFVDRGMGIKKTPLRLLTMTFAAVWFLPGLLASIATIRNLGFENLRRPRMWPLFLVFSAGGLISFRAVFGELIAQGRRRKRKTR
ncbi:MAG TPA: hypothetical protein VNL15_01600 [Dehalococcoidia bacterium]|nr:hypothetical protein [Dehalococcoidia bacterium]